MLHYQQKSRDGNDEAFQKRRNAFENNRNEVFIIIKKDHAQIVQKFLSCCNWLKFWHVEMYLMLIKLIDGHNARAEMGEFNVGLELRSGLWMTVWKSVGPQSGHHNLARKGWHPLFQKLYVFEKSSV